jgi:hypothetical protein
MMEKRGFGKPEKYLTPAEVDERMRQLVQKLD